MAGAVNGLKPLYAEDFSLLDPFCLLPDALKPGSIFLFQRAVVDAGRLSDFTQVGEDPFEVMRVQRQHFRLLFPSLKSTLEVHWRGRSDVALALGEDEIGFELFQERSIDPVEAFARPSRIRHRHIDLGTRHSIGIDDTCRDDRIFLRPGRVGALMGDADDRRAESEGVRHFG